MSKVVLVIDDPKICVGCPLKYYRGRWYCCITHIDIEDGLSSKRTEEICPLKPIPKKNKFNVENYVTVDSENNITLGHYLNAGYNACIDNILGIDTIRYCITCRHSNNGKCAGTEECHECMWLNNHIDKSLGEE